MVSTDGFYDIAFQFTNSHLDCIYHYYEGFNVDYTSRHFSYHEILDMLKVDTFKKYLIPDKKIREISIFTCDESASREESSPMQTGAQHNGYKITIYEIQTIVSYIIKNAIICKLAIYMHDIEFDLSQMQPCDDLMIIDKKGFLPKEYLHHIIKLLENGQTKTITFRYNRDMPLKEDLAEFSDINVHIDPIDFDFAYITDSYHIKLKE